MSRYHFWKKTKLLGFRRVGFKLFHSIILEEKNFFLKKLRLIAYVWVFSGIKLEKVLGTFVFLNFVKHP